MVRIYKCLSIIPVSKIHNELGYFLFSDESQVKTNNMSLATESRVPPSLFDHYIQVELVDLSQERFLRQ